MKEPATGIDLYARFSRDGPPSELALNPPAELPYEAPNLETALSSARPGRKKPTALLAIRSGKHRD